MGNVYPSKASKGTDWQGQVQIASKLTPSSKARKWLPAVLTLEDRHLLLRNEQGCEEILCEQVSETSFKLVVESFKRQEVVFGVVLANSNWSFYHIRFTSLSSQLSWKSAMSMSVQPRWESNTLKCCYMCYKAFSAVRRQHHCRLCGRVVCAGCSQFRAQVPWSAGISKERACKGCVDRLMTEERRPKLLEALSI